MVDAASFRAAFPEFSSAVDYPEPQIEFWLKAAQNALSPIRWADQYDTGVMLLIAHQLVLAKRMSRGGGGGGSSGLVASKSIGGASISYDTSSMAIPGWGIFNSTGYGQQYAFYANLVGAGAIQL